MEDLTSKLPVGAVKWTFTGLFAGGALKGLSILLNKLMDRKIKQDEYGHEDSKDIIARIYSRVDKQEENIKCLNKELDDAHAKYNESMRKLESQTVHLEYCRENVKSLASENAALRAEIAKLNNILLARHIPKE